MTRFFRHGELPLVIMALLTRQPMHAYQMLGALDDLFGDAYEPSTGTVYPAVAALEEAGLIAGEAHERRTVYHLTPLGKEALEDRQDQLARLELRTGVRTQDQDLDATLVRFTEAVRALAGHVQRTTIERVLTTALGRLEHAATKETSRS
ncbi:MAG TPA: PadR family transcriptional regulator [Acidimicrobiales bacterium]|nr:PadR family transcriptional regulator [Acidimicrobiales bacterium]